MKGSSATWDEYQHARTVLGYSHDHALEYTARGRGINIRHVERTVARRKARLAATDTEMESAT